MMNPIIRTTLLLLAFLLPATATAYDFEVDGIYYDIINGNEASVTFSPSATTPVGNDYYGYVIIPSTVTYNGTTYSVTAIGEYAFWNCYDLISVTIPNTVTTIAWYAFSGCSGLTSVDIGDSVTSIGDCAFRDCSALTNVTIPNSVITIGWDAFSYCSGLTNVDIGNSVTTIGDWAFAGCCSLTSVTIGNSVISIGDGAFYECSSLTSVTIGNSVISIGDFAFYNCNGLTSVEIPNSVTSIGEYAFAGCSGLTSLTIPNSVTTIGEYAFAGCTGLVNIIVDSGNLIYDSRNNCNAIIETSSNTLFAGCKNTIIPNSVISIGEYAFYWCRGLTSITIPNTVTSIGSSAFENCSGLTSLTCLATTPPTIGNNSSRAFFSGVTSQATLYVPEESVSAYQSAFNWMDFSQIVGIIDAFEVDGVWYRALDVNTAMMIQRPGEDDYYQGDVVIPESVTYADYTFTVVSIDAGAFEDCYDLTSVVIGDAVKSIGENAFHGCTALTSVTIGSGVTAIGAKAFNYCNFLQTVTCRGTVPPVMASSNCFTNAAYTRATLRVPRTAQADYSTADYWFKFNQIEGYGSAGPGDVDGDGIIGIADITALIDYRLYGETNNEFYFESADLNGNGRIDIADISTLIDMMLFGGN